LSDEARRLVDWQEFYAFIGEIEDRVKYDVLGLFEELQPQCIDEPEKAREMFCSACVAAIYCHCGVLNNINWTQVKPQDLVKMRIWGLPVPILGKPQLSKEFNTV